MDFAVVVIDLLLPDVGMVGLPMGDVDGGMDQRCVGRKEKGTET
jgi:hypothetical protein